MFINLLLLLSALSLSGIAGYYSVIGMTAIFAAAWWPVVIMTGMLEFSKVVVAAWLHRNWSRTPFLLKSYLVVAVMILMFITSLGIFGFLSKAHIEQTSGIGNNRLIIAQIDQQIAVEQGRIDDARKVVQQMDDAVNNILQASARQAARGANAAQQAARLRQAQARDRALLSRSIDESNAKIRAFNDQKLKLDQEQLKLEVEVGPIKYIAELIYGNNPDKDLLEKAVRYVIILIIFVFDPLAILMIIAASMSFPGRRRDAPPPAPSDGGEPADKPMTYRQAMDSIRENDHKHGMMWSDHATAGGAPFNMAIRYAQPDVQPMSHDATPTVDRAVPAATTQPAPEIPSVVPPVAAAEPQPVAQPVAAAEPQPTAQPTAQPVAAAEPQPTAQPTAQPVIETPSTPDPVIQPVPETVASTGSTAEPIPAEPEQTPDAAAQDATNSKPEELLQKIKQYHSVRLEDARRSIR